MATEYKLSYTASEIDEKLGKIDENTTNISKLSEDIADLKENGSGGVVVPSVEPMEDDIPKVFFSEAIPQTKDDAVTAFRYISKTQDISGYAEFKAQGNSSMSYPKKNMTVKMYSDEALTEKLKVKFKEWAAQAKHVYKANWIDLTHARNIVSARLWSDVVKSRKNYLALPELLRTSPNQGAVDGFPVKVYSQGIYQGRYTLNIPKDAWMANMDDSLDEHCILCGEGYNSGCFRSASMSEWTDEVHDSRPTIITNRWLEVINFVMNSTDEEFVANLENYFFVDSLIDYFIFGMVSCGLDAFGKNQLYFTYDGMKWIASMYDMDSTWGLYWNGSKFVSASYSRESFEDFVDGRTGNLLYIRLASLFYNHIQLRYIELKNSALSIPNIINHFERFTDIAPLDLVKEDYASATGGGKFTGIPSQSTNNIQQIRQYIVDRYVYCDEYFASLTPEEPVPATGISLDKTSLMFTDSTTQTITATVVPEDTTDTVVWSVDDNTIATVSGGVVTPVSNGACVITAMAGSVSATCTVEVNISQVILTSIFATYAGGEVTKGTALSDLTGITVTATYSDGSTTVVTDYTLSGEIVEGENTITVSYSGLTTTFTVTGIAQPSVLDGVEFYNNHAYNQSTGELTAKSNHCTTGKFSIDSGWYNISAAAGKFIGIYVWDETDKFVKIRESSSNSMSDVYLISGCRYALQVFDSGATDISIFTIKHKDNGEFTETVELSFCDLEWEIEQNYIQANITTQLASIGVQPTNFTSVIKYIDKIVTVYTMATNKNPSIEPLLPRITTWEGEIKLILTEFSTNLDSAMDYFAENGTSMTIGA